MSYLIDLIQEKLSNGGEVILRTTGGSMNPFFRHNKTEVTLGKVTEPLKKYDVVLFQSPKRNWVLHRITEIVGDEIYTQGDALRLGEMTYQENIIAIVRKYSNGKKTISCDSKWYLFRVKLWMFLKPLRRFLIMIYDFFHKGENENNG